MFIVTYSYKVPKNKVRPYLNLQRRVKAIYLRCGCLSYEVFQKDEKDEEWMEIEKFGNKSHFKKVLAQMDKDPEIPELFRKFCSLVNLKQNPIVTKEFAKRI
ncbi:MAG: hypothetical protein ACE5KJ_03510 [Candidatus Zixiibacteriota bacterium]